MHMMTIIPGSRQAAVMTRQRPINRRRQGLAFGLNTLTDALLIYDALQDLAAALETKRVSVIQSLRGKQIVLDDDEAVG